MVPPLPSSAPGAGGGTAAAIRSVRFGTTEPFGRGYDPREVDRFQRHCAAVVEALSNGWVAAGQQVDFLRARLETIESSTTTTEPASAAGHVPESESELQSAAHRTTEVMADAEKHRELAIAQSAALIDRAHRAAATIIDDAERRAAALERQITVRAQQLTEAAERARQEVSREVAALKGSHPVDRTCADRIGPVIPRARGELQSAATPR